MLKFMQISVLMLFMREPAVKDYRIELIVLALSYNEPPDRARKVTIPHSDITHLYEVLSASLLRS